MGYIHTHTYYTAYSSIKRIEKKTNKINSSDKLKTKETPHESAEHRNDKDACINEI